MAKIENLGKLKDELQRRLSSSQGTDNASVVVGYTQQYAVHVHEDLEMYHNPPTQAKYLEQPAREMQDQLKEMIVTARKQGKPLVQALLLAGLTLQGESQLLCPVDTGALRASAFTKIE